MKILWRCALLLLLPVTLLAQTTTGTILGTVTTDGKALPGVTVTVASPAMQGTRTTVSGESGGYNFSNLPPGEYTATFELAGPRRELLRAGDSRDASVHRDRSAQHLQSTGNRKSGQCRQDGSDAASDDLPADRLEHALYGLQSIHPDAATRRELAKRAELRDADIGVGIPASAHVSLLSGPEVLVRPHRGFCLPGRGPLGADFS